MITINIYQDKELKQTFEHQENDFKAFGWMLRNQGHSVDHALRYEGWKVECIDEETGEKEYWKPYSRAHF